MKKTLLLAACAAMTAFSASAVESQVIGDLLSAPINKVSPNGVWASGEFYGQMTIYNLETGKTWTLMADDDDWSTYYSVGLGNAISDEGLVCLTTEEWNFVPCYWKDGEIVTLPYDSNKWFAMTNAVTPDETMIIGYCTTPGITDGYPCIWTKDEKGAWQTPEILPYPEKDQYGNTPQRVMGLALNNDGSILYAQVIDATGMMSANLLRYTKNDKGEWEYEWLLTDLTYIEGLTYPELPDQPDPTDYMNDEQKEAYQAQLDIFLSTYEPDDNPNTHLEDYMTAAEYDRYAVDCENYNEELRAGIEAREKAEQEMIDKNIHIIGQNNLTISPNGRYVGTFGEAYDWSLWAALLDTETGKYQLIQDADLFPYPATLSISDDGVLSFIDTYMEGGGGIMMSEGEEQKPTGPDESALGFNGYTNTYILTGIDGDIMPIQDWIKAQDPAAYEWMEKNMVHDITTTDYVWDETLEQYVEVPNVAEGLWVTGKLFGTAHFEEFVGNAFNLWNDGYDAETDTYEEAPYYYSYVIAGGFSGLDTTVAEGLKDFTVKVDRNGVISLSEEAAALSVYDLNGRRVFDCSNPATSVSTGLTNGAYIVRVAANDGRVLTTKAIF